MYIYTCIYLYLNMYFYINMYTSSAPSAATAATRSSRAIPVGLDPFSTSGLQNFETSFVPADSKRCVVKRFTTFKTFFEV